MLVSEMKEIVNEEEIFYSRVREITDKIKYKDWYFLHSNFDPRTIQVCFNADCIESGTITEQKGRKWLLSKHMTDSEIVQTAFLAIKIAEEHKLRENFLFNGAAIFGPHLDLFALSSDINSGQLNTDER